MKKILFVIIVLGAILTSCESNKKSYSYAEVQTFIALKQATPTKDSLAITIGSNTYKLPIISIDSVGFYPAESNGGTLRYYQVKK